MAEKPTVPENPASAQTRQQLLQSLQRPISEQLAEATVASRPTPPELRPTNEDLGNLMTNELTKATGRKFSPIEAAKMVGRAYERVDNFKLIGKPVTDLVLGMAIGKGTQMAVRAAFQTAIGIQGGAIVGAVAGGVAAGVKESVMEVVRQKKEYNKETNEVIKSIIKDKAEWAGVDPDEIRKSLKTGFRVNKKKLIKPVARGVVIGAIGGALGAEVIEYLIKHPEITEAVKSYVQSYISSWMPGTGRSEALLQQPEVEEVLPLTIRDSAGNEITKTKVGALTSEGSDEGKRTGVFKWQAPGKEPVDISDEMNTPNTKDSPIFEIRDGKRYLISPAETKAPPTLTPKPSATLPPSPTASPTETPVPKPTATPTPVVSATPEPTKISPLQEIVKAKAELIRHTKSDIAGAFDKLIVTYPELAQAPAAAVGEHINEVSVLADEVITESGIDPKSIPSQVKDKLKDEIKLRMEAKSMFYYNWASEHVLENPKIDPKIASQTAHDWFAKEFDAQGHFTDPSFKNHALDKLKELAKAPVPAADLGPAPGSPGSGELLTPTIPHEGAYQKLIGLYSELKSDAPSAAVGRVVNQPASADLSVQLTNQAIKIVGLDENAVTPKTWVEIQKAIQHEMEKSTQGHFDNIAKEVLDGKRPFNPADFDPNKVSFSPNYYFPSAVKQIRFLSSSGTLPSISLEQINNAPALFELSQPVQARDFPGAFDKLVAAHSELNANAKDPLTLLEESKAVSDQITKDAIIKAGLDPDKVPDAIKNQIKQTAKDQMKAWVMYEYNLSAQHVLENPKIDPKIALKYAHDKFIEDLKPNPVDPNRGPYHSMRTFTLYKVEDLIKEGAIPTSGVTEIPPEILSIPGVEKTAEGFAYTLKPGSNPWEVARQVGGAMLNPDHTPLAADDDRLRDITKKLLEQSAGFRDQAGVTVPGKGWEMTQGEKFTIDHRGIPPGYKLNFNKSVLDTIKGFSKTAESNIVQFPNLASKDLDLAA